ncbi:hypothetical protein ACH4UT_23355 [Streptomyces sp. NPDC020799]|uniref:hypothetical protein n=1 Tax=Streptomyces sp. NPDC020799 TaxID=3365091 RepID=UPI0037B03A6C
MTITLPQVMGDLLPTGAPPQWRVAVDRAAQLLAPRWPTGPVERAPLGVFASLALILYALHRTQSQEPAAVPMSALRDVLDGDLDANDEPVTIKTLIVEGLSAAGHRVHDAEPVMCRAAARVLHQDAPLVVTTPFGAVDVPIGMGGAVPGPSELRSAAAWLKRMLGALDEDTIAALAPAPQPAGPVNVMVIGQVLIISDDSEALVQCAECQQDERGQLAVDGDQVTYTCAQGHISAQRQLGSGHVRQAIARTQADDGVSGPLYVADARLPADADPATLHPVRAACL